ncbi:Cell wall-associated hydrolase, NlpC family [Cryptosporangium aurantiacum]|uniref:Cell wall-associated hydrolase, NlpC family n=1 Tax=Cryptosporangium aurantiacum TaxID=134849 RepID=A0A1M7RM49_9ACTN|nr:Cell wall-associated hydrolase, NlpC family [Cryptosporangium aurantiacum]
MGLLVGSAGVARADPPSPAADRPTTSADSTGATTKKPRTVAERVKQEQIAAEAVAERLEEAKASLATARDDRGRAETRSTIAAQRVLVAREAVADWARDSYIEEAEQPSGFPADPRRRMFGHPNPQTDSAEALLATAEAEERAAASDLAVATALAEAAQSTVDRLGDDLSRRAETIRRLRAGRETVLAAAQSDQEAVDAARSSEYIRDAKGVAGDAALRAIEFALAQRGKPYVWGAEGPDTYDCSGLVQTAFAAAGVSLPRTARPQYRATQIVDTTALLPGDLLFFATNKSNWDTIHHVAIYLGNGKMLHAPTTGDVVRVAPVWWEEFYAATRVVPGRTTPKATPKPSPAPAPEKPAPTKPAPSKPVPSKPVPSPTKPSPSPIQPSPSPSRPGSPSPSESPSGTSSGTPTPSGTPGPSTSPSGSGSPSPSGSSSGSPPTKPDSPSPSCPASPSPTPSGSASPTPTPTPSTSVSPTPCP